MRMFKAENQHQSYQQHMSYQTLAPWENKEFRPPRSMVRTFQKPEFIVRNQDLSAREVRSILPPLRDSGQVSMEQTRLLRERVGEVLYVARPAIIQRLTKKIRLGDQLKQGELSAAQTRDIFISENVDFDEGTERSLFKKFGSGVAGRVAYSDMLQFMTEALDDYKVERDKREFSNLPRHTQRARVRHPSMNSSDFNLAPLAKRGLLDDDYTEMPGAYSRVKLNHAFTERRDAGLRIEIEKCFQECKDDINYIFSNMKKKLLSREEGMINPSKLKGIVTRHQLPLNNALIDKTIERLDPFNSGSVSCKSFVDFLEKCLPLQQGYAGSLPGIKKEDKKEKPPERPRWETSKPLQDIRSQHKSSDNSENSAKEFERFMKLVAALRRRAKGSDVLRTEDARETILKYSEIFSLGFFASETNALLQKNERNGYVEVDNIIDELGAIKGV